LLLDKAKEISIPISSFQEVWKNELDKHRNSFRKKFNSEPEF